MIYPVEIFLRERNDFWVKDLGKDLAQSFGENLGRARAKAELSQEELSDLSTIHRTQIGQLENGLRQPRLDTIVKLAGALGIDPCQLITRIRWVPPSIEGGEFKRT